LRISDELLLEIKAFGLPILFAWKVGGKGCLEGGGPAVFFRD